MTSVLEPEASPEPAPPSRQAHLKHRRGTRWMHWINFPLITIMIWSGLRIYTSARIIHFSVTIAFLLFFVVHILQVARTGWRNFTSMVTGYELVDDVHSDA